MDRVDAIPLERVYAAGKALIANSPTGENGRPYLAELCGMDAHFDDLVDAVAAADSARPAVSPPLKARAGRLTMDWQPIETAPRDGTRFLACGPHVEGVWVVRWNTMSGGPGWLDDSCAGHSDYWNYIDNEDAYSHWMPLPAPPQP